VTARVRASDPASGQDEWEYTALNDAAQTSAGLLTEGESRRIVAAADVSSDCVSPADSAESAAESADESADESAVSISDPVSLKRIASFHVDGDDAQDDDLLWYDVTELPVVLALL
jgi:hypothetical protein